ncbi:hypothetical protein [Massilia yuzhufengensis]|uniref:Oxygen-independent coproporphyrinogen-3 oxidase n=1 Tax=Massilia yuzhufengensis TaxID=1164594 RepID=A0A1I1QN20_9BURK|nr:hypothetical protein [Massilia yuzhufengensis]SFD23435.1 oxygen-independent coproporphyrinogen-3 oxidase [Massilia yuzhufengensis]
MHAAILPSQAAPTGSRAFLHAIASLPAQDRRPLSLRLHVPSLLSCAGGAATLDTYLAYLKRELAMHAVLFAGTRSLRQLRFDGIGAAGLSNAQLTGLLTHLRAGFRFMGDDGADVEAAVDPGGLPQARLASLRRQGFNAIRFEYGGAPGTHQALPLLAGAARDAGLRTVCVALAYGMPGQGVGQLRRMLDATLAAAPDRVLLRHRPTAGAASGAAAQRLRQHCIERLDRAGYAITGAGQFVRAGAKPDPASFEYYPGTHLVGCGAGALGAVGPVLYRNAEALRDYYALIDRDQVPVARVLQRMRREQTRPYLMQVKDFQDADQ